jgi:KamA family protein
LDRIAEDTSIQEVLLSGGDPLTVRDELLADLVKQLSRISHLRRLRIHSRLPIVIPERVTDSLLDWLSTSRLTPIFVVHANHPRELDAEVLAALERLVEAGIPVLNQAVLLRGVNDRVSTLVDLCEKLIDARVLPYYLHQLDRVSGAAHFEVPVERGLELLGEIRKRLPGYAVPRYVQEQPGQLSKLPLG